MSIKCLLLVGICLGIARYVYAVDLTLKPGENSNAVIDATIRKIRTKCILAEDYYFLRRLAAAQMKSIAATTGGIWRVTNAQLTTVQSACSGTLKTTCTKVKTEFSIDVPTITMSDLQKPLYSGLVMSLFILHSIKPIPLQKAKQALSWKNHIYSKGNDTQFLIWANELEKSSGCAGTQMDLVFLIDSSGSVGSSNFAKTRTFLKSVVNKFDVGPEKTRVAVVRFSSSPVVSFNLGTYSTKSAVEKAISSITYNGGGTNTASALDKARTNVFTNKRNTTVAAKVLVLVTDGWSNNENMTVTAANKLKDDGVIIFTIGIVNPKVSELTASASEPSCTHFIKLKYYNEIDFIVKEIQTESCKAPTSVNTNLTNNGIPNSNETKEQVLDVTNTTQSTSGTIITVSVKCGVVIVYGAYNNSQPGPASYDYITNATDMKPGKLYLIKQTAGSTFFVTIISNKRFDLNSPACNNPHYNISINTTNPSINVTCRQNNKEILCSTDDIKIVLDPGFKNPCTKENRQKGLYIFPHPNHPDKYLECDSKGNLTIVWCPVNQTFDAALKTCKPKVTTIPGIPLKLEPCVINPPKYYYVHPKSISKYIQCSQWGQSYQMNCPKSLYWRPDPPICDYNPGGKVCGSNTKGTFQSHPLSAFYFIVCHTDTDYEIRECELKKKWDQTLNKCV